MAEEPEEIRSENNNPPRRRLRNVLLAVLSLVIVVGAGVVIFLSQNLFGSALPPNTHTPLSSATSGSGSRPTAKPEISETPEALASGTTGVIPSQIPATETPEALQTSETPEGQTLAPTVQGGNATDTPEASQTQEAHIQIAAAPILIRSTSGDVIGDGTIQVFAPQHVLASETVLIDLELHFDHQYITPTPFGARTAFPVTRVTSTPPAGEPTSTPRIPIHEETGLDIYQRMGASLSCSNASFSGCDSGFNSTQIKVASLSGMTWSWFLSAKPGVIGKEDLRLQLWTVVQVGDQGEQQGNSLFDYPFQIEVGSSNGATGQPDRVTLILAILVAIACLLLIAFVVLRLRGTNLSGGVAQRRTKPGATVFISYRRADSWGLALKIRDTLQAKGFDVFMDIHDIHEGQFGEIIQKAIRERDSFILILSPNTLQSDWVVNETKYALETKRKIIPVLDRFDIYKDPIPEDLAVIRSYNAVSITPEYVDAGLERLVQFLQKH